MWTALPINSLRSLTAILRNEPGSVAGMLKSPSAITIGKDFYNKKWEHRGRYLNLEGLYPAWWGAGEEQPSNGAVSSPFIDDLHQILELHHPLHCTLQARLPWHFPEAAVTHRQPELGKAWLFISSHTALVCVCTGEAVMVLPVGMTRISYQWISKMCLLLSRSYWVLLLVSFLLL